MSNKNFELKLTPQNEEWLNLIPNPSQNMDIVINKLIDATINDGLFLETISQALTLADLAKFKVSYSKLQSKRVEYMNELEINVNSQNRKKQKNSYEEFEDEEKYDVEEYDDKPIGRQKQTPQPKKEKINGHGFDEQTF